MRAGTHRELAITWRTGLAACALGHWLTVHDARIVALPADRLNIRVEGCVWAKVRVHMCVGEKGVHVRQYF